MTGVRTDIIAERMAAGATREQAEAYADETIRAIVRADREALRSGDE